MAISARNWTYRAGKKSGAAICYAAKGAEASRLRRRRHELARRFGIPDDLLAGSLNQVMRKCGKESCRCASGEGHPMWTLTFSVSGRRRVEFIPDDLISIIGPLVGAGRAYRDAVIELMAINAQLLTLWRKERRARLSHLGLER